MTQLLTTATRVTIGSATLVDHVFHNHFFGNPECGILDAGLTDHCATSVNLPVSCEKYDDTETTFEVVPFIYNENSKQVYLELLSNELKMPCLYEDLEEHFDMFLEYIQKN